MGFRGFRAFDYRPLQGLGLEGTYAAEEAKAVHMGSCLNYGPFWGPSYEGAALLEDLNRELSLENYPHCKRTLDIGKPREPTLMYL